MIPNRCGIFPYGGHTPCKPLERWCHLKWRSPKFHEMPWNSVIFSFAIHEFHGISGIFYGSPKEPDVNWNNNLDVLGIPWNTVIFDLAATEFHRIPWDIPWSSIEPRVMWGGALFSMELRSCRIKCDQVPWNAMKHLICMEIKEYSL